MHTTIHPHMHTGKKAHRHTGKQAYIHTYIHTNIHTYIHTHTHACVQMCTKFHQCAHVHSVNSNAAILSKHKHTRPPRMQNQHQQLHYININADTHSRTLNSFSRLCRIFVQSIVETLCRACVHPFASTLPEGSRCKGKKVAEEVELGAIRGQGRV